jgi:glucokinase
VNIVDRWLENLAKGIANISCVVDPDIFIVGGAIALKGDRFLETLMDKAKKYCIHPEALRMEKSFLGEDAGLIGAAMLIPKGKRD